MTGEIAIAADVAEKAAAKEIKDIGKEAAGKTVDIGKRLDVNKQLQDTPSVDKVDISKRISPEKITEVEKLDPVTQAISEKLESIDGIRDVLKSFDDGGKRLETLKESLDTINNTDSSPMEKLSAGSRINQIKGDILEQATKNSLSEAGFEVTQKIDMVQGKFGDTLPDVIATNNTDKAIEALGRIIQPGETISAECKCGSSLYLNQQLEHHIPNQLSGLPGARTLITTADVSNTTSGLADQVCKAYDAKLVSVNESARDILENMKGVVA